MKNEKYDRSIKSLGILLVLSCASLAIAPMYFTTVGHSKTIWIPFFDHGALPPNIWCADLSWQLILKRIMYVSLVSIPILFSCFRHNRFRWLLILGITLLAGYITVQGLHRIGREIHPLGFGCLALFSLLASVLLVLQILSTFHREIKQEQ